MKNIADAFLPSNSDHIPDSIQKAFKAQFQRAINVEWNTNPDGFEAIFYLLEVEHIAKLSLEGQLMEFKKNLCVKEIPELIRLKSISYGEIMSAIIIDNGSSIKIELVMQNSQMLRHLLLYDEAGTLLNSTVLTLLDKEPL